MNQLKTDEATDRFLSEMEEKRLLADNAPVAKCSFTPHESLMGYEYGTEVFDDGSLDPETHPSDFVAISDLTEADLMAAHGDTPEDAYIRMIDHLSLPLAPEPELRRDRELRQEHRSGRRIVVTR
jgi:hypothetical protein